MIPVDLYVAYMLAVVILMVIPGPNVALIVANSIAHGARYGLLTVGATTTAVIVHLTLTVLGTSVVLDYLAASFDWLRWLGVAYLIWLGIGAWRARADDLSKVGAQERSPRLILARGFLVGLTNPKTLLFYGAFLPQFITPGPTASDQLLLLAVSFVVIAIVCDGTWALLAGRLRNLLLAHVRLRNRLTGGLLVGAGVGLALARRP
ncbi:MAG: LysE family translocator [Alphaproteobacteria bacterium]|nr:LysE family translocator [Alphaproteobacteria bacterium]